MNDPIIQELQQAMRDNAAAKRELAKARTALRRSLVKARKKTDLTDGEIAAIWGKSRQSLYKFIGPEKPRVKS